MSLRKLTRVLRGRPEMVARLLLVAEETSLDSVVAPEDVYAIVAPLLVGKTCENLVVVALNKRRHLLNAEILTVGSDAFTIVDPRQIFRWALMQGPSGASAIVLAHNHPSGDPTPSAQDKDVTKRISSAGRVLGIQLIDHIVVGGTSFVSLAERGELPSY